MEEFSWEYSMEELVELTGWLTDKYTSKESSSVTYETAERLMGSVLYCLEEYRRAWESREYGQEQTMPAAREGITLREAYQRGYQLVLDKVQEARKVYHRLIQDFEDYGCVNLRDTVKKGMPAFFRHYDARFDTQNTILTLDYPTLGPLTGKNGVDAILDYLLHIEMEAMLLGAFSRDAVVQLFEENGLGLCRDFMGNICEAVLERAVCCMIADRSVWELILEPEDWGCIRAYFDLPPCQARIQEKAEVNACLDRMEGRIKGLIAQLTDRLGGGSPLGQYLSAAAREYAVRFYYSN